MATRKSASTYFHSKKAVSEALQRQRGQPFSSRFSFPKPEKSWPYRGKTLSFKGQAVGTLIHGRICFMSSYRDGLQRAEIVGFFMMFALIDSTTNCLIT